MGLKFELENVFSISDFRAMLNEAQEQTKTSDVLVLKNSKPAYAFLSFEKYKKIMTLLEELKQEL